MNLGFIIVDNTKLGGTVDSLEEQEALQKDLDRLETCCHQQWHAVQQRKMPGAAIGMKECQTQVQTRKRAAGEEASKLVTGLAVVL